MTIASTFNDDRKYFHFLGLFLFKIKGQRIFTVGNTI